MKKIFLILFIPLMLLMSCKSSAGPDNPNDPWWYGGEIEIMLETDREVDFTKTAISVYHLKYGGTTASHWVMAGENQWTVVILLDCDPQPYFLMTGCYKLISDNFYLRRKGDVNWIKLTCIVDEPLGCPSNCDCKALKFLFNNGQLQNPC